MAGLGWVDEEDQGCALLVKRGGRVDLISLHPGLPISLRKTRKRNCKFRCLQKASMLRCRFSSN